MEIKPVLTKIGLDEREIAVYLAALELGPSTIQQIAKQANIKRTTVYLVAKSLMAKGLLGQYTTRKGLHLTAQSPDFLLTQLAEKQKELAGILPQLKALARKEAYQPQVSYYEGRQGYFTVLEDTLQKHASEILWLGDPADIYKIVGEKYDEEYYVPTRVQRKIKFRALLFRNEWSEKLKASDSPALLRQTKFLPDNFPFKSSQFIYQDKVILISSTKELICVMIQSKDLAEMERAKFEMLWKQFD